MPIVKVRDMEMFYEEHGTGDPLLLIMGLGGNLDWWGDPFLQALAVHYRVITFDNRGVGRSQQVETGYTIAEFADDSVALLDALNIPQAHILGISMGGMIAQEIALQHPEHVVKLILVATNCGGRMAIPAESHVLDMLDRRNTTVEESKSRLMQVLFPHDFIESNADFIHENWKQVTKKPTADVTFGRQLLAIRAWSSCDRLSQLSMPTLIVHGSADILIPPANAKLLAQHIAHATLQLIEGAGHGINAQKPIETAQVIVDFLQ